MTVVVERAIVAVVKLQAASMDEADAAFAVLRDRVEWNLPAVRVNVLGLHVAKIVTRDVTTRTVSIRGTIGKPIAKVTT